MAQYKKNKAISESGEAKQNYGLRKLSVGLASVLLSSTMWAGNSGHAHAATENTEKSNNSTSENDNQGTSSVATDSGIVVSMVSDSGNDSADPAKAAEAQASDSTKQRTDASQASANTAEVSNKADASSEANAEEKSANAQEANAIQKEEAAQEQSRAKTDANASGEDATAKNGNSAKNTDAGDAKAASESENVNSGNIQSGDAGSKSSVTLTKDNETGETSVSVATDSANMATLDANSLMANSFSNNAKMAVSLLADTGASAGNVASLSAASEYSNYDHSTSLTDPETAKASYKKGENVPVSFAFANNTGTDQKITATMTVYHGVTPVGQARAVSKVLKAGEAYDVAKNAADQGQFTIDNSWLQNNSGYTIQIKVTDASGKQIGLKNLGLAIEDDWTKFPRYGVIAGSGDHAAGIPNDPELLKKYYEQIEEMKNMHVNSYFFYDVYKDAANPFPDEDSYTQEWVTWTSNKPQISTQAVKDLVAKVHDTNASAMLYNMIHARNTYANQQNTPGLPDDSQLMYNANNGAFGSKGQPMTDAAAAQVYYNPASPSWQKFISEVMIEAMKRGNFDGWNGDTIGNNTVTTSEDKGTDKTFQVKDTYGVFSKSVMDAFKGKKSDGSDYYYTINNVNAEGINDCLNNVSVAYAELWPSGSFDNNAITEYGDLKNVVDSVRDASGKSLIVSAYLKNNSIGSDNTYNANAELLTTASIAAAGGYHMELDANASSNDQFGTGILGNEYYPNQDHKVSEDMNRLLYQYSQFQVQYENFLRGNGVTNDTVMAKTYKADGTQVSRDENNSTSAGRNGNQVWTFTKKGDGFKTIQLINLMGINSDWDNTSGNNNKNPETQKNLSVTYPLGSMSESQAKAYANNVYVASPDDWDKGSMTKASAAAVNNGDGTYSLKINVPELSLWDMVYIQDAKATDTTANAGNASSGKGASFADQHKDLLDRAAADGIAVTKGESKNYDNQDDAEKDIASQASAIKNTLDNYEAAKSSYDAAQASYEAAEKKYEEAQNSNDPHMVKGISQGLTFKGEPTADVDINAKNYIKASAWNDSDNTAVYNKELVAKNFGGDDLTANRAEATTADKYSGNGKTYTDIKMNTGETVTATYTNLRNTSYIDEQGKSHRVSKIVYAIRLNQSTTNDGTANLFLSNNPNNTFWYSAKNEKGGSVEFSIAPTFYDENGNKIDMANAWFSMSSLNHGIFGTEYFNPESNTAVTIPGSSIIKHDDGSYYSDNANGSDAAGFDWDSPDSPNRYYGAALMKIVNGSEFKVGNKSEDGQDVYVWLNIDSSLATAYKPVKPTSAAPAKPTITYHDATVTTPLNSAVKRTIHYVVKGGTAQAPADRVDQLSFSGKSVNGTETWDGNKDFADVASPELKGYKVDRQVVSNKGIGHDHADIYEVVTYTPATQNLSHTVKRTIHYVVKGGTAQAPADRVDQLNYTATKNLATGAETWSGNQDFADVASPELKGYNVDRQVVSNKGIGHDHADIYEVVTYTPATQNLSHTVKRTIHYVVKGGRVPAPADRVDQLNYTDTKNMATGAESWSGNQDFADVASPAIKGYTVDRQVVSNKGIGHDHADIYEVVTYTPDIQKLDVTYHDDTANKDLKKDEISGESSTVASKDGNPYTTESSINAYKGQGYELVSDDTGGMQLTFDDDASRDQHFVVHLKHGTSTKQISDDVNRMINYKMSDGSPAPAQVKDSIHFNGTQTIDNVTKAVTNTTWEPNKDFKDVNSPAVKGYTPDRKVVSDKNIAHDHADIVENVLYTPDPQKATVVYIDKTTGDQLRSDSMNGVTHGHSGYTTKDKIKHYEDNGYKLVSDDTKGDEIVYDDDPAVDQHYTVYLEHTYVTVTPVNPQAPGKPINPDPTGVKYPAGVDKPSLERDVNRTINYKMSDGSKAPAQVKDKLHFTDTKVFDKVTGKMVSEKWSPNQDFKDVNSPAVKGYTPDRKVVSDKNIAHDHADIVENVVYNPDPQKATVVYIDKTTGDQLRSDSMNGVTHGHSGYTTKDKIKHYEDNGYKLVSDDTKGDEIVYDDDPAVDQHYTVYLEHTYVTVTPVNPQAPGKPINPDPTGVKYPAGVDKPSLERDVNRTINYKMSDGSKAPAQVKDKLHFADTKVFDKVTGKMVSEKWSPNQDFKDVNSPTVKGYTPDRKVVSDKNIAHDHADIVENVLYTPDPQKAKVTYVDQTTGKTLKTDDLKGVPNAKSGYTTKSSIQDYEDNGYALVSDDTKGDEIVYDDDDAADQSYTVVLKHTYQTIMEGSGVVPGTPINKNPNGVKYPDGLDDASLGKDVKRDVTYRMSDGTQAPGPVDSVLHFTAQKVIDKVTGEVLSTEWSPAQDYDDVVSPEIKGYTPDQKVISDKGITHEHSDIHEIVTYDPNPQKATVTYVDETIGKTITVKNLAGKSNGHSGYTTAEEIQALKNAGYVLVSDDTGGSEVVFDDDDSVDQSYVVKLKHRIDNSEEKHTATRTIRLHNPDGTIKTIKQVGHVQRPVMTDAVTGKKTYGKWTTDNWDMFKTPQIDGYTPTLDEVVKKLVTGDTKDETVDIYYKKNPAPKAPEKPAETAKAPEAEPAPAEDAPAPQLPQTGNSKDAASLAAGTFAVGTSLLATVLKRRFQDKKQ